MRTAAAALLLSLSLAPAVADEKIHDTGILNEAKVVIEQSVAAPDKGIPKELFERAECVGVFPGLKKAAFVVGGEFGRGVFTCRQQDGSMGSPVFFTVGGASVGWQFGGQEADVILLIMNNNGVTHLLKDRFTIGGEATATAGPIGRTAQAATDAQLHAQILSWSRSRGVFLGAALEGTVVRPDADANKRLYGKGMPPKDILLSHAAGIPKDALAFVTTASKFSQRS